MILRKKSMKYRESGRSMVEMLGVLAIVGVLSILMFFGYKIAIARHKANETINDVLLRATNVPMVDEQFTTRANGYEWVFSELGANQGRFYTMYTIADHTMGYIYKVEVSFIHRLVCKRILALKPKHVDAIYVKEDHDDPYGDDNKFDGENASELCDNEENIMAFFFDDNLDN